MINWKHFFDPAINNIEKKNVISDTNSKSKKSQCYIFKVKLLLQKMFSL